MKVHKHDNSRGHGVDGGHGVVGQKPQSGTMKYYEEIMKSEPYTETGHAKSTGKQTEKMLKKHCDPAKGNMKARGASDANKTSEVVSKKLSEKHKIHKGYTKGKSKEA